jgi:hypothetical protein
VYGTLGVRAPGNTPGSRISSVGWADKNGNVWLFGGYGPDSVNDYGGITWVLNDLWEFSSSDMEWHGWEEAAPEE